VLTKATTATRIRCFREPGQASSKRLYMKCYGWIRSRIYPGSDAAEAPRQCRGRFHDACGEVTLDTFLLEDILTHCATTTRSSCAIGRLDSLMISVAFAGPGSPLCHHGLCVFKHDIDARVIQQHQLSCTTTRALLDFLINPPTVKNVQFGSN
jgi:hypothetical protein